MNETQHVSLSVAVWCGNVCCETLRRGYNMKNGLNFFDRRTFFTPSRLLKGPVFLRSILWVILAHRRVHALTHKEISIWSLSVFSLHWSSSSSRTFFHLFASWVWSSNSCNFFLQLVRANIVLRMFCCSCVDCLLIMMIQIILMIRVPYFKDCSGFCQFLVVFIFIFSLFLGGIFKKRYESSVS